MAKAIEDTAFYRFNPLIGLNEVGAHPDDHGRSLRDFHQAMEERRQTQPAGLSATSTHDTKRGEDARARLYVLSEMPGAWADAVARWSEMLRERRTNGAGTGVDRGPSGCSTRLSPRHGPRICCRLTPGGVGLLSKRLTEFMLKAAREAKTHTSWTAPDEAYEDALQALRRGSPGPQRAETASSLTFTPSVSRSLSLARSTALRRRSSR